ncbi:MAG: zinc-binding dehydrogenase [Defluviitaleaceae bacterium]|nr:zinc-binding dehydrogenase [Defluviitaleaceae bacterium]
MKTLVVNKDGSLEIKEIPKPEYSAKEALVKTIACGMCGTDVKLIHRSFKGVPESSYPIMLGHEGVGEVVEIGSEVKGLKVGDKVLLTFVDSNPALFGDLGSAWGALSEYAIVQDIEAYKEGTAPSVAYAQTVLSDDLDPVDAVMLVTFREVLSAIRYFGVKPKDSVVVFGCGPVGLTFIKLLNLYGCKDIIAVDIVDEKLKDASASGAKLAFNNKNTNLAEAIRTSYPNGVQYVLDAVGLPSVANQAMSLLADRGSVLCYGVLEKEEITIDFSKASYNWNFICQQMPEKAEEGAAHAQILEWIRSGQLVMKDFISDYFNFDDSVEAYKDLLDRKILKKGIIKF